MSVLNRMLRDFPFRCYLRARLNQARYRLYSVGDSGLGANHDGIELVGDGIDNLLHKIITSFSFLFLFSNFSTHFQNNISAF